MSYPINNRGDITNINRFEEKYKCRNDSCFNESKRCIKNTKGAKGDNGTKGDKGNKGDKGDIGQKGESGSIIPGPTICNPTFNVAVIDGNPSTLLHYCLNGRVFVTYKISLPDIPETSNSPVIGSVVIANLPIPPSTLPNPQVYAVFESLAIPIIATVESGTFIQFFPVTANISSRYNVNNTVTIFYQIFFEFPFIVGPGTVTQQPRITDISLNVDLSYDRLSLI